MRSAPSTTIGPGSTIHQNSTGDCSPNIIGNGNTTNCPPKGPNNETLGRQIKEEADKLHDMAAEYEHERRTEQPPELAKAMTTNQFSDQFATFYLEDIARLRRQAFEHLGPGIKSEEEELAWDYISEPQALQQRTIGPGSGVRYAELLKALGQKISDTADIGR
jgi:hypothetical protein